jgi:5-hydroxyisourate hydrolase-like protein (transthyretin family)
MSICIPYYKGGECHKGPGGPSYYYGDEVVVKGRSKPSHDGKVKIQRRHGDEDWKTVARPELNENGRYRYAWKTTAEDADQGIPHRFRTVLPNHDRSPVQKVYVLFYE